MSTPGQLLLVICAFLCLIPGDALFCQQCVAPKPGEPCEMKSCEIGAEGTCIGLIVHKDGILFEKILGCTRKVDVSCGKTRDDPEKGMRYVLRCCDEKDFCNSLF